jgi:DNA-binding NtrC family response regulator
VLFADRFVLLPSGPALDLATGLSVRLVAGITDAAPATEGAVFERPCLASGDGRRLADEGLHDERRFEAWWVSDGPDRTQPAAFGGASILMDEAGHATARALVARADLVDEGRVADLRMPIGPLASWPQAVALASRELRVRGLVPVCARALGRLRDVRGLAERLCTRSLVVIQDVVDDGRAEADALEAAIRLSASRVRVAGLLRPQRVDAVALTPGQVAERAPRFGDDLEWREPAATLGAPVDRPPGASERRRLLCAAERHARRGGHREAALLWIRLALAGRRRGDRRTAHRMLRRLPPIGVGLGVDLAAAAALVSAELMLDDGHWLAAERLADTLRLLGSAADGCIETEARLLQARALLGQGRAREARVLAASHAAHASLEGRRFLLVAEASLACGDLVSACHALRQAGDHPRRSAVDDPDLACAVHLASARLQVRLGDPTACRQHLALAAARRDGRTPRPLRDALELVRVEAGRAFGWSSRAAGGCRVRGRQLASRSLARWARRLGGGGPTTPATGRSPMTAPTGGSDVSLTEVIEILRLCQESSDERHGLRAACARVQLLLSATAVGICGLEGGVAVTVGRGERPRAVVDRTLALGATIPPAPNTLGEVEAATVVQCAGRPLAALWAIWAVWPHHATERVTNLFEATAVAVTPLVQIALERERAASVAAASTAGLLGQSRAMHSVRDEVRRAGSAPFPVLIIGESGSGKELAARAIHELSARRARPFCAVNCAALTDELFEAELFGHARGAFTGAVAERPGLFEEADGGTLFLDEIGELSARGQAKLLRAIQEREVRRVGENLPRRVDARVVAATNRPLADEVSQGRFRQDLLYRLDVLRIEIPPLRERRDDVPALAREFWRQAAERTGSRALLAPETAAALARYDWPGNVRELQNVLASLIVRAPLRGRVGPEWLPERVRGGDGGAVVTLEEARRRCDRRAVSDALAMHGGCREAAARALGVTRQGLAKLITRLGLHDAGGEPPS